MQKTFLRTFVALLAISFALSAAPVKADDPKAEEIIAKHLDSIGSKEKRAAVKNQVAAGKCEFTAKVPYAKLVGKTLIVSDAGNLFFVSGFNSQNYPFEKIGLFDKKVAIPFVVAGNRSPLGGFLHENNKIISERLFAGSVSTTWNLLDVENLKAKLKTAGKKKIDGRETYVLNYFPKSEISSDFSIKLYFDAKTFQHLRTEYQHTLPSKTYQSGILGGNSESGARNLLVENFGDFKDAGGLILPHSYKIYLLMDAQTTTHDFEWNITIAQYHFNQNLDAGFFSFSEK